MVKNTKGGSGHKSQARKYETSAKQTNLKTRFSEDEYEHYAQVVATLGNGMCHVMCKDGKKRLCIIRGKFRGRGKRDNIICNGKWVLVGGRDFEASKSGEGKDLEKCDLLEVYSDLDKERLKTLGGFADFITRDHTFANVSGGDDNDVEFTNNAGEDEYDNLMKELRGSNQQISLESVSENNGEEDDTINVDDI
jgi:translation initiation factor 1A